MAKPLHFSPIPASAARKALEVGMAGMGMLGFTPMPVQREIWKLHDAKVRGYPLFENIAVEVVRRAGKTEGLFSLAVGRCSTTEDYQMTYCAQSGTKSRERFYGLLRRLSRHSAGTGWRARESRGEERIEWDNGAIMRFLPPKASSFRGDKIDWLVLDEAQEVDEEDANDLMGSVLPVFDTSEGPQLTIAGTAGAFRNGLLWEGLVRGRSGQWGILEYAAAVADGERIDLDDEDLWLAVHPGPAGVIGKDKVLAVLRKRRAEMTDEMFAREYLGVWPEAMTAAAFSAEVWARLGREMVTRPSRFGLAYDVTPGGTRTAVVAVWRDSVGVAMAEVIREDAGTAWAPDFIGNLAIKYRTPVGYDTAGIDTLAVADEIARRFKGRVPMQGLTTIDFTVACAVLSNEVLAGNFRHFRQQALDESISVASRRPIRDGGWAWGRLKSSGHIHPLVAMTVALKMHDDLPQQRITTVLTARRPA